MGSRYSLRFAVMGIVAALCSMTFATTAPAYFDSGWHDGLGIGDGGLLLSQRCFGMADRLRNFGRVEIPRGRCRDWHGRLSMVHSWSPRSCDLMLELHDCVGAGLHRELDRDMAETAQAVGYPRWTAFRPYRLRSVRKGIGASATFGVMTPYKAEILCDVDTDREKKIRAFMTDADNKRYQFERTLGGRTFSISRKCVPTRETASE